MNGTATVRVQNVDRQSGYKTVALVDDANGTIISTRRYDIGNAQRLGSGHSRKIAFAQLRKDALAAGYKVANLNAIS